MNNVYVYIYLDPRKSGNYNYGEFHFNYEPFYIGQGTGIRIFRHLEPNSLKSKSYKNHKILELVKLGFDLKNGFIFKIKEGLSREEADKLEIGLIRLIGRTDLQLGPLTNLTDGGDQVNKGYRHTKEAKEKISKSSSERKFPLESVKRGAIARRKLSEEQAKDIYEKYWVWGFTGPELARIFKVHKCTVVKIVKGSYGDGKITEKFNGGYKRKLNDSQVHDIYEKYWVWNFKQDRLGKIFGVDASVIGDIVNERHYRDSLSRVGIL